MPQAPKKIPVYSADGRLSSARYSLSAIARLESLSLVVVRRDRRGNPTCALFRPMDGANPLLATAHLGQRYSYLEHVGEGRTWAHKSLIERQDVEQLGLTCDTSRDVDLFIRAIFRAVPLSVMRDDDPPSPSAPAKVVPIDRGRKRTTDARSTRKAA